MRRTSPGLGFKSARLVHYDPFQGSILTDWTGLVLAGSVTASSLTRDSTIAYKGSSSMRLSATAGAAEAQYAAVKFLPFFARKLYAEIIFGLDENIANAWSVFFRLISENQSRAATRRSGTIYWEQNSQRWYYQDSTGNYVMITTLINRHVGYPSASGRGKVWTKVGFGIDHQNVLYDFALINSEILDLSGIALRNNQANEEIMNTHTEFGSYIKANLAVNVWFSEFKLYEYWDRNHLLNLLEEMEWGP